MLSHLRTAKPVLFTSTVWALGAYSAIVAVTPSNSPNAFSPAVACCCVALSTCNTCNSFHFIYYSGFLSMLFVKPACLLYSVHPSGDLLEGRLHRRNPHLRAIVMRGLNTSFEYFYFGLRRFCFSSEAALQVLGLRHWPSEPCESD